MNHYYNEFNKQTAEWLRRLCSTDLIPNGVVDERSIKEIAPEEVAGDGQRHFFAGIGGWPEALRLAGWPTSRSVWTGSCPCQPFSLAGNQQGYADDRDLWPDFARLISKCRPDTIFGEQVPGAIGHGWIDRVQTDLEREGYAVGFCILGAHSIGAPHIRNRLYWVANSTSSRRAGTEQQSKSETRDKARVQLFGTDGKISGLGDSNGSGPFTGIEAATTDGHGHTTEPAGGGPWSDYRVIQCRDGKARRIPVEPEFFPLADGVPSRVVRLSGYGNAIVPQTAALFIRAFLETEKQNRSGDNVPTSV